METKSNDTKTICFLSLKTDLDKSFTCIQLYYYLLKQHPNKKAIILYDVMDNKYYNKLCFKPTEPKVHLDQLNPKHSLNIEDYIDYDYILFDISNQNYNIYESFLYNSQVIVTVNSQLSNIEFQDVELNREIHKEVIYPFIGEKLFPVTHALIVLNKFSFGNNNQKKYSDIVNKLKKDIYIELSDVVLSELIEHDINAFNEDSTYARFFNELIQHLEPTEEDTYDFVYSHE